MIDFNFRLGSGSVGLVIAPLLCGVQPGSSLRADCRTLISFVIAKNHLTNVLQSSMDFFLVEMEIIRF